MIQNYPLLCTALKLSDISRYISHNPPPALPFLSDQNVLNPLKRVMESSCKCTNIYRTLIVRTKGNSTSC